MEKFAAVVVNKGRKFRGEAYDIGSNVHISTFNIYGHGRGGWRSCESVKLWSPTQGFVWCNPSYIEDREVAPEVEQADYAKYVDSTINSTIGWCRSRKPNSIEKEVLEFARRVIAKHHAEMLEAFDAATGSKGPDVVDVVESTLNWAFNLPYSKAKCVRLGLRALTKKGVLSHPAFVPAWTIYLDLRGLSRFVKKYLPEELQAQCI